MSSTIIAAPPTGIEATSGAMAAAVKLALDAIGPTYRSDLALLRVWQRGERRMREEEARRTLDTTPHGTRAEQHKRRLAENQIKRTARGFQDAAPLSLDDALVQRIDRLVHTAAIGRRGRRRRCRNPRGAACEALMAISLGLE